MGFGYKNAQELSTSARYSRKSERLTPGEVWGGGGVRQVGERTVLVEILLLFAVANISARNSIKAAERVTLYLTTGLA